MPSKGVVKMIWNLNGHYFPLHRSGPMCYADQQGLYGVVQTMKKFATRLTMLHSGSRRHCWPSLPPKGGRLPDLRRSDTQQNIRPANR